MINLHCTQKLIAQLPVKQGLLPQNPEFPPHLHQDDAQIIANNPLSGWHASLLTIQNENCVLLVHDQTRFPILIIGFTQKSFAALDHYFVDCFMNTLLKADATEAQMQTAHTLLAPVFINKSKNKSVLGTISQMTRDLEEMLWLNKAQITYCSPYKPQFGWQSDPVLPVIRLQELNKRFGLLMLCWLY